MVGSELMTFDEANSVEVLAGDVNGWKRPSGYDGALERHADALRNATGTAIHEWRLHITRQRGKGRRR